MEPSASQIRNFCFTSFDVSDEFMNNLKKIDVGYLIAGNEICPTTNKPHIQGYCELRRKRTLSSIKKLFVSKSVHIEARKGNSEQASAYCRKYDVDAYERGTISKPGERTDLERTRDMILRDGLGMDSVVRDTFNYQCVRMAEKALTYCERKRDWKPDVYWFHGYSGSGKTKAALEGCGGVDNCWISSGNLKWFDGYDAHENVILDDFRRDDMSFSALLRLIDRYPYRVEYKGGSRQFLAKRIYITCPYSPTQLFWGSSEDIVQLLRRLKEIRMFENTSNNGPPETKSETHSEKDSLDGWD